MNGNGRVAKQDIIDRVLEGKDSDTKARVLEFVYRLNIDPTDELFLFCIAIGYLETIVLEAPEQWETLFANFRSNLEQWKDNHLKTLETSAIFVEQLTTMTHSLTEQTRYTDDIAKGLMRIGKQLESTGKPSATLAGAIRSLNSKLDKTSSKDTSEILSAIETLTNTVKASTALTPAPNTNAGYMGQPSPTQYPINGETSSPPMISIEMMTTTRRNIRVVNLMLVLLLVLTAANAWLLWQQKTVIGWLLIKANRMDCQNGLIAPNSPICRQFTK